jgi:nucleoside-diphosphate-sugar epimerase
MPLPRLIITGSSGFIGKRLLDGLKDRFEIVGLARRSQSRCGAPRHDNISWIQTDVGDRESVAAAFRMIRETGGADFVIHLAAHYDYTGDDNPEYTRTNVHGLRHVLEECRSLDLQRFVFTSSVAACRFPAPGTRLDESSPPDGEHVYARSKRLGEEMLAEYRDEVPSVIVRLAAVFSDWCEYTPLHVFIETWLSKAWNSRILGGRGASAIPYLHARELTPFFSRVIRHHQRIGSAQVVIGSPNHTVSHLELYRLVHQYSGIEDRPPVLMPAPLARLGVWGRDLLGRLLGHRPFERPWMVAYIDDSLEVDASRTHLLLDWQPRARLFMSRRMAFLIDHRKTDPLEWARRNEAVEKKVRLRPNLRIHRLLETHQETIRRRVLGELLAGPESDVRFRATRRASPQVLEWRFTVAWRHVLNSVRAQDRGLFLGYCRDFAGTRFAEGVPVVEIVRVLRLIERSAIEAVSEDPDAAGLEGALYAHVTMTIEFGCDQVLEVYEDLSGEEFADEGTPTAAQF